MTTIPAGAGGGGSSTIVSDLNIVGGRLSLVAGVPISRHDQIGKSTLRWVPFGGKTALWNGSAVEVFTDASDITLALSGLTANRLYDVFLKDNAGTRELSLNIWRNSGQAITAATNASPIVITAAGHGISANDEVYVSGVQDTNLHLVSGNESPANGSWVPGSVTTDTITLTGSVGVRDYIWGGYLAARASTGLLTLQNGLLCLTGDPTKRYVGTIRTTGTTTTEDSQVKRFVWNAYNQVERVLNRTADGGSPHTVQNIPGTGTPTDPPGWLFRLWDNGADSRVEWVQGLSGSPVKLYWYYGAFAAGVAHYATKLGIDGTQASETLSAQWASANDYQHFHSTSLQLLGPGYHFSDIHEIEILNVQATVFQGGITGTLWG